MDYNTQRKKISLPEYGRTVHKMVDWVCTIEDRDERNKQIQAVIAIMGGMHTHLRDVNDFKHKLWDHVHIMSDFKIDIDSPYPIPTAETFKLETKDVVYESESIRIKHYGRNIQKMIRNLANSEDSPAKENSILLLANHMKKSYVTWNKESVDDTMIFRDLEYLSGGKIKMPADTVLAAAYNLNTTPTAPRNHKVMQSSGGRQQSSNGRNDRNDSRNGGRQQQQQQQQQGGARKRRRRIN